MATVELSNSAPGEEWQGREGTRYFTNVAAETTALGDVRSAAKCLSFESLFAAVSEYNTTVVGASHGADTDRKD